MNDLGATLDATISGSAAARAHAKSSETGTGAAGAVSGMSEGEPGHRVMDASGIRPSAQTCPAGLIGGAAYAGASGPPLMIIEGLKRLFRAGERAAVDGVTLDDLLRASLLALAAVRPRLWLRTTDPAHLMAAGFEHARDGSVPHSSMRGREVSTGSAPGKEAAVPGFVLLQDYALISAGIFDVVSRNVCRFRAYKQAGRGRRLEARSVRE